ncbi:hypothetical protein Tco_0971798 [Tanacetum coccineum]
MEITARSDGNPTRYEHRLPPRDRCQLTGPELVRETTGNDCSNQESVANCQKRQKSYADVRRKPMEFQVGDMVMLKVSPWKGVIHFGKHVFESQEMSGKKNLVIPLEETQLDDKLHYIEEPVEIMDRKVKQLKQSRILIVKLRWNSR